MGALPQSPLPLLLLPEADTIICNGSDDKDEQDDDVDDDEDNEECNEDDNEEWFNIWTTGTIVDFDVDDVFPIMVPVAVGVGELQDGGGGSVGELLDEEEEEDDAIITSNIVLPIGRELLWEWEVLLLLLTVVVPVIVCKIKLFLIWCVQFDDRLKFSLAPSLSPPTSLIIGISDSSVLFVVGGGEESIAFNFDNDDQYC